MWSAVCCGKIEGRRNMVICKVLLRGLKMVFQKVKDLRNFLRMEEDREGSKKVQEAWQGLSEEEVVEYKNLIGKIKKMLDDIESYIERCRKSPPIK